MVNSKNFIFNRSQKAAFFGIFATSIFLLFVILNLRNQNNTEVIIFSFMCFISVGFVFYKQSLRINIEQKKLQVSYLVFGITLYTKTINIPPKGSIVFRDQFVATQGSGMAGTNWLELYLSRNKNGDVSEKTIFYYTQKHTQKDLKTLKELKDIFSKSFSYKIKDETSRSHWKL